MPNSSKKLNYQSFSGLGVDVAINRADDLDKKLLEELSRSKNPSVLDLGCGAGGQSLRMALAGAEVTAIDKHDFSKRFETLRKENNLSEKQLSFRQADISDIVKELSVFDFVCLQRTIHYLHYLDALELLKNLKGLLKEKIYISVTGLNSEVGNNYSKSIEIENRFEKLTSKDAEIFRILEPVCLYRKEEFAELLNTSGFEIEECWESAFGNIKAVCKKPEAVLPV